MLKKQFKALIILFTVSVIGITLVGCSKSSTTKSNTEKIVNIYTWANYVPDTVVKGFEKSTGIKVNYSNFSTNEEMLAKLQAAKGGQYDVIICADYMVQNMAKQKSVLLKPINQSAISNYKNLDKAYLGQYYDKTNKYSVPYSLGSQMIVYNPDKVKIDIKGISDLWDSSLKGSEVLLEDSRSVIGMALTKLGYSINETDPAKLAEAKAELKKLRANVKVFDADTPMTSLINGDTNIGVMWGSQASAALKGNSKFKIVYPKEGMQFETDNLVIPVKAPHAQNAEKFINYVLDGKVSSEVTTSIEYINVTTAAKQFMPKSVLDNKAIYVPNEEFTKAKHLEDAGSASKDYDLIWSEFKQQ
ncbi:spermidine/putrescine ABC transporter substrate-binding protein [Clostridium bowmanii]|uniref:polyamine ABC transporter substrate-binding protein n=1 Tax=Clostridium bowmanii TaxID=132925 RepID=UPI001C0C819B|nr:spermidine/putrescine ABC transporter substrate-binding protein [Clostridium bowmanii]MBU3190443.1 spermidine/putrescine ABC transporter substrate-binding protein [Clostridium bowmanii]MCA1074957.1 spermidine/putrescine ABC transporter substrate-binding protein [Clostridium bowmanii]